MRENEKDLPWLTELHPEGFRKVGEPNKCDDGYLEMAVCGGCGEYKLCNVNRASRDNAAPILIAICNSCNS